MRAQPRNGATMANSKRRIRMTAKRQFSDDTLAALREGKGLRIRAGTVPHRFIGI